MAQKQKLAPLHPEEILLEAFMQPLGYLGFPAFAVEAAVMYNFFTALDELVLTTSRLPRRAFLVQGAFWLLMFATMDA
jgi:hypothetical protein